MSAVKTHGYSALVSASLRMWRAWSVLLPVIVVNALVQGVLVASPAVNDATAFAVLRAIVSAIAFLIAYGLVLSAAVQVADGLVGWRAAATRLRERAGAFALVSLSLGLVVLIGLAFGTYLGWIALSVGVFIPTAAMVGAGNPVTRGLVTIRQRPLRWLVTILITAAIVLIGSFLMGVTAFFIRGFAAATLVWLVAGVLIAWLATAFALIYRNAQDPSIN